MGEAYSMVSVKKKSDQAGRSSGKKMYIVLFRWEDVATFTKDEKGVKVTAFPLLKARSRLVCMPLHRPSTFMPILKVKTMPVAISIMSISNIRVPAWSLTK